MTLSEIKDWQDLRIGDAVIQKNDNVIYQVEAIDLKYTDHHVCIRGDWVRDAELANYQKVEVDKKEPLLLEDLIHERNSRPVSEYIEKLEEKIDRLTKENIKLKDEVESWKKVANSKVNWDEINEYSDLLSKLAGVR